VPLTIEIVTPERIVFQEEGVESVTLPGIEGELTVLPRHAALMTALQPGALRFRRGGEEFDVALSGGFLEVLNDKVTVLATTAERAEELDAERVAEARRRAEERLRNRESEIDVARAVAALERATARMKVLERRRRRPGGPPQQQQAPPPTSPPA